MRTDEMLKVEEIVGNLEAENERLRADYQRICRGHDQLHNERDKAQAEIEQLRAVLMEIRDNGYRAALCHAVAKTALEQKSP
jgi:uncharacterized coiled-coil DUF342 family protein